MENNKLYTCYPNCHNPDNKIEKIMLKKKDIKPKYVKMSTMFENVKKDIKIKVKSNDPLEEYSRDYYNKKFNDIGFNKHHTQY
jgi:hypothetical protein